MKKIIFLLIISVLFVNCDNAKEPHSDIEYGVTKLSGKVTDEIQGQIPRVFMLHVPSPITRKPRYYEIFIKEDNTYSIEIPVYSYTFADIDTDTSLKRHIWLRPNQETILDIHYDKDGKDHISLKNDFGYTEKDMADIPNIIFGIVNREPVIPDESNLTPDEFSRWTVSRINKIVEEVETAPGLSPTSKRLATIHLQLYYLNIAVRTYSRIVNQDTDEGKQAPEYQFLKHFDLNNPDCLSSDAYLLILEGILETGAFRIPPVEEHNPAQWINNVKDKVKDFIGNDQGLFYDMLLSVAYTRQLDYMKPFTDKQKKNITSYFKDRPVYAKLLFAENDDVISLLNE